MPTPRKDSTDSAGGAGAMPTWLFQLLKAIGPGQLLKAIGPGAPVAAMFLIMWYVVVEPERQYARSELSVIKEQNAEIKQQFAVLQERLAVMTVSFQRDTSWGRPDMVEWAKLLDAMNPNVVVPIPAPN